VRERLNGPLAVLEPAGDPGQPAFGDPVAENDRPSDSGGDRDRHDDSSGSGGGGSSGPG